MESQGVKAKSKYRCQCHGLPPRHHKQLGSLGTWSCPVTGRKCKLVGHGPKAGKPGEGAADRSGQGKTGQGKGQKGQKKKGG